MSKTSPLYPEIDLSNPDPLVNPNPDSSPSLYPYIHPSDLAGDNPFPDTYHYHEDDNYSPSAPPECIDSLLIRIPGAILHLIDNDYSVELALGDLTVHALLQGESAVAVIACVADEIQWPLTKDAASVKLDDSHYFFNLNGPPLLDSDSDSDSSEDGGKKKKKKKKDKDKGKGKDKGSDGNFLNYGLTIASKGQENLVMEWDLILENYSAFSVQQIVTRDLVKGEVLDATLAKEMSPEELEKGGKEERRVMEERCSAYWTTLAPNVEEYSGMAGKVIAMGSGQLVKGILWCGDVTMDRLNWGNEVLMKRIAKGDKDAEISPETLKRLKRYFLTESQ